MEALNLNSLGPTGNISSIISLIVGLYTFLKVREVSKAQRDERRITQELLDVDQIERDLGRIINKLGELNDSDSISMANDLSRRLGAIQGTRRALDRIDKSQADGDHISVEFGFFSNDHVGQLIDNSTSHLDIMTGSTRLISGYYMMDKIREACERGVRVRVIGIDPDAPDDVLNDATRTVSHPAPSSAEEYRKLMRDNQLSLMESVKNWKCNNSKLRFEYTTHPGVPRVSFARCDESISFGFLQLFRDAQPDEIKDRQYIHVSLESTLGQVISRHFTMAWDEGQQILPAP